MSAQPLQESIPPVPGQRVSAKAIASLVLSIVAPATLYISSPLAFIAVLMTYPDEGPSHAPWVAPLAFLSLPLACWLVAVPLAVSVIRKSTGRSGGWGLAVASLWVSGVLFVIALVLSLRYVPMLFY